LAAEKNFPEFRATLRQGIHYLVFINLLAAVLLMVLAEPIIRLLFERGRFSPLATQRAALALACLAPGLAALSLVNILARAFYALGDTRTPMKISIFCLALNLTFAIALVGPLAQGGLGMANTLSATMNVALLFYALRRKLKDLELPGLQQQFRWLLLVLASAGATAWLCAWGWEARFGHATLAGKMGAVFVPMTAATVLYFGLTTWLRLGAAREMLAMAGNLLRRK
jgi:putative peptidoglycan lipid II flippase